MGYVIAAIIVLLIVAGAVTFFVVGATRKPGSAEPEEPGGEGAPPGIAAPDESEAGDTTQFSDAREGTEPGADTPERPRVGDPGPEAGAPHSGGSSERRR